MCSNEIFGSVLRMAIALLRGVKKKPKLWKTHPNKSIW